MLFGFVSTLGITPCLGFAFREITLTPEAYTMVRPLLYCSADVCLVCMHAGWLFWHGMCRPAVLPR